MNDLTDPPLTIPAGTQVVTRVPAHDEAGAELAPAGAVGIVVAAPDRVDGAYIVRLPDGREAALRRKHLSIRSTRPTTATCSRSSAAWSRTCAPTVRCGSSMPCT